MTNSESQAKNRESWAPPRVGLEVEHSPDCGRVSRWDRRRSSRALHCVAIRGCRSTSRWPSWGALALTFQLSARSWLIAVYGVVFALTVWK